MKYRIRLCIGFFFTISGVILLTSCRAATPTTMTEKIKIVASTTIIGDVVNMVGGDQIELTVLLPVDADPHSFSPAPKVVAEIETADIVFVNGFGLEEALEDLIYTTAEEKVVSISEGIDPMVFDDAKEGTDAEHEHEHRNIDPHVWMNPLHVKIWAGNIKDSLIKIDPSNTEPYSVNARIYQSKLDDLHNWILDQVAPIPLQNRVLITDHDTLSYFAALYDFEVIGVVLPGGSTLAEPSAKDIAQLEDMIEEYNVPAIFIGTTVNTQLADRISRDTGIKLIPLYSGSLSNQNGPAPTYIDMMRYNVTEIVDIFAP